MTFISRIDNPFSRVEPTCPSVRIEIKLFPIVSDGVYWTTLSFLNLSRGENSHHSTSVIITFLQDHPGFFFLPGGENSHRGHLKVRFGEYMFGEA